MRICSSSAHAFRRGLVGVLLALPAACALSGPELETHSQHLVRTLSGAPLGEVSMVERFVVPQELGVPLHDLWLVEGHLSKSATRQVALGSPAEATTSSRRPLTSWLGDAGIVLAPGELLEPGEAYSLVALGLGVLGEFTVVPQRGALLHPTSFTVPAGGWVGYCQVEGSWGWSSPAGEEWEDPLGPVTVGPGDRPVEVKIGLEGAAGKDRCLRLAVPDSGASIFIPPMNVAGVSVVPTPLVIDGPRAESTPVDGEEAPLTLLVHAGVASVDVPAGFTYVELIGPGAPVSIYYRGEVPTRLPLGALSPGEHRLRATYVSADGLSSARAWQFTTEDESGYVVLSEVMSNPVGPEPQNEWIEVQNVGRAPASLAGYVLSDGVGSVELPAVTLAAGATGVIVRSDYRPSPDLDVPPDAAAVPIVVSELTSGGLANGGERLRLLVPGGATASSFPAIAGRSGQSVARRHPLSPDVAASFGHHAPPGSSPGIANQLMD